MQLIRKDPNRPVLLDRSETIGGLPLRTLTFPMLEQTGCVDHVFTTREGGVSSGDCAAMNFNYDREDDPMVVDANYQRIADAFGGGRSLRHFVCAHQGHTGNVRVVDVRDGGEGTLFRRWGRDVDGMVTNTPGLILGVFTADCTPVYLVDPVHRCRHRGGRHRPDAHPFRHRSGGPGLRGRAVHLPGLLRNFRGRRRGVQRPLRRPGRSDSLQSPHP